MARKKCRVVFMADSVGLSAVLMSRRGSVNAINFPRGARPTVKDLQRAEKRLMKGCKELG